MLTCITKCLLHTVICGNVFMRVADTCALNRTLLTAREISVDGITESAASMVSCY
jgi:hypothetical protein